MCWVGSGYPDITDEVDDTGGGGSGSLGENPRVYDCVRILNGSAYIDKCGKCVGGTTGIKSCVDNFNEKIDDEELPDCMEEVLNSLRKLSGNSVADIIQKFAGEVPGYNLKFAQELKNGADGLTRVAWVNNVIKDGYVTINFNTNRDVLKNVTDMATATTILHESVHAFLYTYYKDDPKSATATYPELFKKYIFKKAGINSNTTQHN
ncbi:hypothetical protein [Sphingobacterium hungaricum]|uniref:SprT-like family protein n=1 Tax=Sphingobacterium hungaricum TaxID=2082723 RepID=A0A928USU5_9SPHI|nr:hypothetical protein [Sphingobacterium hungaricum]MBE8712681.1 hypothetical protein [Sphingobacterium hungaricum]